MEITSSGFKLRYKDLMIIHQKDNPLVFCGSGKSNFQMSHGNFQITDDLFSKIPLRQFSIQGGNIIFENLITLNFEESDDLLQIHFEPLDKTLNRLWVTLPLQPNEHIYGCGEQYSHFDLRGKRVPIWVSEQGVGRNKKDLITIFADFFSNAGGDWYTTYFPQPTFVSSRMYFCHVETSSYTVFDFTKDHLQIEIWQLPVTVKIYCAESWQDLFAKMTTILGRQPKIPEWILDGAILGIQGGTQIMLEKTEKMRNKGLKIAGVWIQDWEGKRITTFGRQLMWNWQYSEELYPNLPKTIEVLQKEDIRVLGYINPFLALEGNLYTEASAKGFLVKNKNGDEYHVVVTTFPAAIVDLTNPLACEWLKNVIKKNMIGIGLSGWMADYGEYLPTDAVLYSGESAELVHNKFPVLWAKVNYEAVKESQKDDVVYFMRSGYTGSARYTPLYWNGDQLVNWSKDDGLASIIPATLSLGMSGVAFTHSDIGGYTTLAKNVPDMIKTVRSKEVFLRWTEIAAFMPVMRTHEGNWPDENWQFDSDEETIEHFVKMTELHRRLKNYFLKCVHEYYETGLPIIRPLFLHYDEPFCYTEQYEFLVGRDILLCPVLEKDVTQMTVHLPDDLWVHYWTGKEYYGGEYRIPVPLGEPAFFIRKEGEKPWKD